MAVYTNGFSLFEGSPGIISSNNRIHHEFCMSSGQVLPQVSVSGVSLCGTASQKHLRVTPKYSNWPFADKIITFHFQEEGKG